MMKWNFALVLVCLLGACSSAPRPLPAGHLAPPPEPVGEIPAIVTGTPGLAPPAPEPRLELYTVVVDGVPVRELLFALSRDAGLNVDIHPEVSGTVTLNAVDQTLPQILNRIARQVSLRYEIERPNLIISPDRPFLRSYRVDYVNMARRTTSEVNVATQIATTGSGGAEEARSGSNNNSTTTLTNESHNQFWDTLIGNIAGILGAGEGLSESVLVNRESGLITVRANAAQHADIRKLVDQVLARAQRQVLIEATIVEVELSERFQAGVDWSLIDAGSGITFNQQLTGTNLAAAPVTTLTINKPSAANLLATIKALEQFGDLKVLSSPKVMALNNQTAMLKVVDNRVYFTISVDITAGTATTAGQVTYESTVHTVPVGFIMAVTPQIGDNEAITLNVRPTISRILGFVQDPNPALAQANVTSNVPEIQVREIESVLKVSSGQIAVLGGLMQDTVQKNRNGVPVLSDLPFIGNLFSYRDELVRKTELVIFLRPAIIRQASVDADLKPFRSYLPEQPPAR